MDIFKKLFYSIQKHDFEIFFDPSLVWVIYLLVFVILLLENGFLLAAFLPGDSLLILIGVLIAKGILNFALVLLFLTIAASLGSWISFLQGKWMENNRIVKIWLSYLPVQYHKRAYNMFHRHGLLALLISRFIAFVRTLLPTITGLSGLSNVHFQFFNWISAFIWVFILTLIGFILGKTSIFQHYEEESMLFLVMLPLALLTIGLFGLLIIIWRRKRFVSLNKETTTT